MRQHTFGSMARQVAVTVGVLALFRLGAHLPSPAVSESFLSARSSALSSALTLKGEQVYSLFGLGVIPYVSAVLLFSLLGRSVPFLRRLQDDGQSGALRKRRYIRWCALVIGAAASLASLRPLQNTDGRSLMATTGGWPMSASHVVYQLAGLLVLLALADLVSSRGLGNGVSVLMLATVVSGLPPAVEMMKTWPVAAVLVYLSCTVASVVLLAVASRWVRNVPLYPIHPQSPGSPAGNLAMRVTSGGAGPMLFAGSFMVGANALAHSLPLPSDVQRPLLELFNGRSTSSLLLVGLLTVGFARLYVNVASDPIEGANTMTRSGRFMRGAAPGVETARRIAVMNNASGWSYALVLTPVVLAPVLMQLISGHNVPVGISGSSLVIPTLVAAEIVSSWVRPKRA